MAELEAQTGLSREELVAAMESAYTVESISQPVHGAKEDAHTLTIEDQLEDKESFESPVLNRIALTQAMDELEEWEAQLIRMRYMEEQTQTQVADELGMNQVAVSRLEKKILIKMRRKLA